jgi:hypothetical protein
MSRSVKIPSVASFLVTESSKSSVDSRRVDMHPNSFSRNDRTIVCTNDLNSLERWQAHELTHIPSDVFSFGQDSGDNVGEHFQGFSRIRSSNILRVIIEVLNIRAPIRLLVGVTTIGLVFEFSSMYKYQMNNTYHLRSHSFRNSQNGNFVSGQMVCRNMRSTDP